MPAARIIGFTGLLLVVTVGAFDLRGDETLIAEDETLLKKGGFQTDGPALLEFFRKRTLSSADQSRIADLVRKLGDPSFPVREKASQALISEGRAALPFLRLALQDPDLEIARRSQRCLEAIDSTAWTAQSVSAARLLAVRRPAGATAVLLNYLPFADDEGVEEELLAALNAVGVSNGKADPLLVAALKDRTPICRGAAALVLGRCPEADKRAAVRALLADPDPKVRLRAAEGLLGGKDRQAIPVLVDLLGSAPQAIAWQAEERLYRIAGEKAPSVVFGSGTDTERRKSQEAWATWWRDHGTQVDLAAIDLEQRMLGLTLLVTVDGYKGTGKVWEIGPDGKTRWEFTNVQGPTDAVMLSANRVLVAEHGGRRVTERDLQGNVLKTYPVSGNPHDCQRLRNGNIFIATWPSEVLEVTSAGTPVSSFSSRHGSVTSGQKLRNGHLVYVTQNGNIVELDPRGNEVRVIKTDRAPGFRLGIEEVPGGRLLVTFQGAGKVVEYDPAGKPIWECSVASATAASRLPNGHTLVCSNNNRVVEVNRAGQEVWQQTLQGRPFRIRRR